MTQEKFKKEFATELESLMVKYEIAQSITIFPLEGMTRIMTYSVKKEEEKKMSEVFVRFSDLIGKIDTETVSTLNDFLEQTFEEYEDKEESMSQVTWETIAYQNAEELLSAEDYENLENAQILKLAAIEANEWERAAKHRESELSILKKVMEIVELKDPTEENLDY